jgi:antitoxin component YwqK of YwqJK toxin-antitoxin module
MNRFLILILLCLSNSALKSQNVDTIVGAPTGTLESDTLRYESGTFKTVNYYSGDAKILRSVNYYENENVSEVRNYQNGILHGWMWSWYDDGLAKSYLIYWYGLLIGGTSWYPSVHVESFVTTQNGITTSTWYYENDSVKSIVKERLNVGLISEEKRCENGRLEYVTYFDSCYQHREYYCTGALKLSCKRSKQGVFVGGFTQWYENGEIAVRGNYLNQDGLYPVKTGIWTYFDSEGRTIKKEKYDKGKLIWTK